MISISFRQYLILKKLYKAKPDTVQLEFGSNDFTFLYDNKLIDSEADFVPSDMLMGGFGVPNGRATITKEGESIYNSFCIESRRHWQEIFIPQALNIIVSVITTIVTFFILQYLTK